MFVQAEPPASRATVRAVKQAKKNYKQRVRGRRTRVVASERVEERYANLGVTHRIREVPNSTYFAVCRIGGNARAVVTASGKVATITLNAYETAVMLAGVMPVYVCSGTGFGVYHLPNPQWRRLRARLTKAFEWTVRVERTDVARSRQPTFPPPSVVLVVVDSHTAALRNMTPQRFASFADLAKALGR